MNTKRIIKGIMLTLVSMAGGFLALAVPFRIFDSLSRQGVQALFIAEIIIYFLTAMIFLCIKDKQKKKRAKRQQYYLKRKEKVEKMQEEWLNIAA